MLEVFSMRTERCGVVNMDIEEPVSTVKEAVKKFDELVYEANLYFEKEYQSFESEDTSDPEFGVIKRIVFKDSNCCEVQQIGIVDWEKVN